MYALQAKSTAQAWIPANDPAERRILLVQGDTAQRDQLQDYLAEHGYGVHVAGLIREMDAILAMATIDLVVVQTGAAVDAGLELCRRLGGSEGPCLILAGGFDATDRILALELGADDYLAAPFNPRELLARIKAVLRRKGGKRQAALEPGRRHFLGLRFDFGSHLLCRLDGGPPIALTPGEFALLSVFLANPGRVLNREELLEMARGDTDVFDRVIDVQVSRLRQKLAPFARDPVIRTHRHAGYQFVAEVH